MRAIALMPTADHSERSDFPAHALALVERGHAAEAPNAALQAEPSALRLVQTQAGGLHIRFSAGVAGLTERAIALTLRCADQALYRAKAEGRGQVHLESCA